MRERGGGAAAGGEEGDGGAAIAGDARSPELIARALRYTISRTNCTVLMQTLDLQTQRANTRSQTLRRASRFDLTIGKGDNSNTLVRTTAMRPDATAKGYSRET